MLDVIKTFRLLSSSSAVDNCLVACVIHNVLYNSVCNISISRIRLDRERSTMNVRMICDLRFIAIAQIWVESRLLRDVQYIFSRDLSRATRKRQERYRGRQ